MSEELKSSTNNDNFEEMLDEQFKEVEENESGRVVGTVELITPSEVLVSVVGRKQQGVIPLNELSVNPVNDPNEVVKIGDKLDLLIMKTNDVEGTIMLSKKRIDSRKGFEILQEACKNKEVLTGTVKEVVNGGVIVVTDDYRVFVPASQASLQRDANLEELLDTEVQYRLIEVSQRGRRTKVIGSIKSVLREESNAARAAFWESAEEGQVRTGVVRSLTDYAVFVDLGGVTGMIHKSELSWKRIKHPSEVLNVGDTVEVTIMKLDPKKKQISLSYKKQEDNPWVILEKNYPVGSEVEVTIVGLTAFGAFAKIIDGIDGLIHISQICYERIEKPADRLSIGDVVKVKITAIDFENKKVSLSIKALLPEPERPAPRPKKNKQKAKDEKPVSMEDTLVASIDSDDGLVVSDDIKIDTDTAEEAVEEAVEEVAPAEVVEEAVEETAPAEAVEEAAPAEAVVEAVEEAAPAEAVEEAVEEAAPVE